MFSGQEVTLPYETVTKRGAMVKASRTGPRTSFASGSTLSFFGNGYTASGMIIPEVLSF